MIVDSVLNIGTDELTPKEWRRLFSRLRYSDDDGNVYEPWMVYPHKKKARIPRGAWSLLPNHITYTDERVRPMGREFDFKATLDAPGFTGQIDALKSMFEQEQGIVVAQPGFGKTQVVLAFASACQTPVLVLVHTEDILQQWADRCAEIIPDARIGVIRGSEDTSRGADVTISTVQTFRRRLRVEEDLAPRFGAVILDEAHHAPASTFDEILNELPAFYRFGVTATVSRADGKQPYMRTVLGPIIFKDKFKSKIPVQVVPVKSHRFYYGYRGSWDWRNLLNALKADETRNNTIAKLVVAEIKADCSVLVLSREISHLQAIQEHIELEFKFDKGWTQGVVILAAKLVNKKERKQILDDFRAGKIKCILATQLADEALDVPILSRVFLTFPGKHDGRLIQQIGRALREHKEKDDAVIYDVVDERVGVLRRQWMQRKRAYKSMSIKVAKGRSK